MRIQISNLSKSYGGTWVLSRLNLELDSRQPWCLMSPSGSGKTTLLRLLLGLEQPDEGEILILGDEDRPKAGQAKGIRPRFSAVFQEDRLCEAFSPVDNLLMAAGPGVGARQVREELSLLLPEDCLEKPVCTFSGGMKRRTAICRAMIAPSKIVVMDEPFTGLDANTRERTIRYVLNRLDGRMLVAATHQAEEAKMLGGRIIHL